MKYKLEEILTSKQPLNNSKHDSLIRQIAITNEVSPNIMTLFTNAYYKTDKVEGEIDLLQLLYNSQEYKEIFDYKEIPYRDAKLLLFEIKTNDTTKNYYKAKGQLFKSKQELLRLTGYYDIDCFYGFGMGTGFAWRYERI